MKKITLALGLLLAFSLTNAQIGEYKNIVPENMTLENVIINYPVVTFHDDKETINEICDMTKLQPNGIQGKLSTWSDNYFFLKRESDGEVVILIIMFRNNVWVDEVVDVNVALKANVKKGTYVFTRREH